jgi:hypothetical protein
MKTAKMKTLIIAGTCRQIKHVKGNEISVLQCSFIRTNRKNA